MPKLDREIKRNEAERLIENPQFVNAFADVREDIVHVLETAPLSRKDTQRLKIKLELLVEIRSKIESRIRLCDVDEFNQRKAEKVS